LEEIRRICLQNISTISSRFTVNYNHLIKVEKTYFNINSGWVLLVHVEPVVTCLSVIIRILELDLKVKLIIEVNFDTWHFDIWQNNLHNM
jgi:hypothetical protein